MTILKKHDADKYAALDKLTGRINKLTPMVPAKDSDDEAKVQSLARAVSGTTLDLHAQQRILVGSRLHSFSNALYMSTQKLGTSRQQMTLSSRNQVEQSGAVGKSL